MKTVLIYLLLVGVMLCAIEYGRQKGLREVVKKDIKKTLDDDLTRIHFGYRRGAGRIIHEAQRRGWLDNAQGAELIHFAIEKVGGSFADFKD